MPSAAERVRACRARKRAGKARLLVEIDVYEVADMLVESGYLQTWDSDNREAIADALEQLIARMTPARIET